MGAYCLPYGTCCTECALLLPESLVAGNCTYQNVDRLNVALHPLLQQVVRTAFFRYFKVWSEGVAERLVLSACSGPATQGQAGSGD